METGNPSWVRAFGALAAVAWVAFGLTGLCGWSGCGRPVTGGDYEVPTKEKALEALIACIDAAAKAKPTRAPIAVGGNREQAVLVSANAKVLTVKVGGGEMPIPWKALKDEDIVSAGRASVDGRVDRGLAVVDYCLAAGMKDRAGDILDEIALLEAAKARAADIGARRTAVAAISGVKPGPEPAKTPAVSKTADGPKPDPAKEKEAVQPTENDDWFCPAHDGSHTFTSKDNLPPPLKFKWYWTVPQGNVYQVLSSGGKVFVKGRHPNNTPVGTRNGVHNYVLNMETGKQEAEDPDGTSPNDMCHGWPGGTHGGKIYQADDGGPPFCGADVWGPIQISPDQGFWTVVQHMKVDGPNPGLYCSRLGQGVGRAWKVIQEVNQKQWAKDECSGDTAIGPGVVYAMVQWHVTTQQKSGLLCYDIESGKERWHVAGDFDNVSAGKDFCVAVSNQRVMAAYAAADGKLQWQAPLGVKLECHPMVADDIVRVYDEGGNLSAFRIVEKDGKRFVRGEGSAAQIGRYAGPKTFGRQNHCFCYSADGTFYVANGLGVYGQKRGHPTWSWTLPPEYQKFVGPLGQPIIARGKLLAVGKSGVVCFDTAGPAKDEAPKK